MSEYTGIVADQARFEVMAQAAQVGGLRPRVGVRTVTGTAAVDETRAMLLEATGADTIG